VGRLVRRIAENFRLPYFTITPTFSICPVHGYIRGEHHHCPYDKEETGDATAAGNTLAAEAAERRETAAAGATERR